MLAFQRFVSGTGADFGGWETGSGRGIHQSIAVWSSLSPWIESALLNAGVRELTTIDYNPPEIIGGNAPIRSLGQAELPKLYAAPLCVSAAERSASRWPIIGRSASSILRCITPYSARSSTWSRESVFAASHSRASAACTLGCCFSCTRWRTDASS